ncbi:MAG: hypothetical protein ACRYGA_07915 [Janthinobacterium lividum]
MLPADCTTCEADPLRRAAGRGTRRTSRIGSPSRSRNLAAPLISQPTAFLAPAQPVRNAKAQGVVVRGLSRFEGTRPLTLL